MARSPHVRGIRSVRHRSLACHATRGIERLCHGCAINARSGASGDTAKGPEIVAAQGLAPGTPNGIRTRVTSLKDRPRGTPRHANGRPRNDLRVCGTPPNAPESVRLCDRCAMNMRWPHQWMRPSPVATSRPPFDATPVPDVSETSPSFTARRFVPAPSLVLVLLGREAGAGCSEARSCWANWAG